jgi:hypothetical protein
MVLLTISVLIMNGCANYHFGDISKAFCYSTDTEYRAQIKATLEDNGFKVDIKYCATVGLIDALIVREGE